MSVVKYQDIQQCPQEKATIEMTSGVAVPGEEGFQGATGSSERRIVLVGKTGAGKSAAGNTILGREAFDDDVSPSSSTTECHKAKGNVGDRKVAVIDTPGLFDTSLNKEEVLKRIKMCISLSAPGPHAFLVVLQLGRFTQEEKETIEMIQTTFGKDAAKYTMVLFTHGNKLKKKKKTIEDYISENADLQIFIQNCNSRYHVFENETEDPEQTNILLDKIDKMTMYNGAKWYTNESFMRAEKAIEKEKERLLKEKEVQKQKELDKLKAKLALQYNQEEERRVQMRNKEKARAEAIEKEKERRRMEMEAQNQKELYELKAKLALQDYQEEERRVQMRYEEEARAEAIEKEKERLRKEMEAQKQKELDEQRAELASQAYQEQERRVQMRYEDEARAQAERSNAFTRMKVVAGCAVAGGVIGSLGGPIGVAAGAAVGAAVGAVSVEVSKHCCVQ